MENMIGSNFSRFARSPVWLSENRLASLACMQLSIHLCSGLASKFAFPAFRPKFVFSKKQNLQTVVPVHPEREDVWIGTHIEFTNRGSWSAWNNWAGQACGPTYSQCKSSGEHWTHSPDWMGYARWDNAPTNPFCVQGAVAISECSFCRS